MSVQREEIWCEKQSETEIYRKICVCVCVCKPEKRSSELDVGGDSCKLESFAGQTFSSRLQHYPCLPYLRSCAFTFSWPLQQLRFMSFSHLPSFGLVCYTNFLLKLQLKCYNNNNLKVFHTHAYMCHARPCYCWLFFVHKCLKEHISGRRTQKNIELSFSH